MDDDDAPPELVDVTALPEDDEKAKSQEADSRVPITLVTGKAGAPKKEGCNRCHFCLRNTYILYTDPSLCRVSWGREDDITELYPDREAWQKDSCYYERFVSSPVVI
jgi:hypothetical protein